MDKKIKKALVESLIRKNDADLFVMKLRERYLQRRVIMEKRLQIILGQLQSQIKEVEDYNIFLAEVLKDESFDSPQEEMKIVTAK